MKLGKGEAIFLLCYFISIASMFVFGDIYNKPRVLWAVFLLLIIIMYITVVLTLKVSRYNFLFRLAVIILFSVAAVSSKKPQMMMYAALMCAADLTNFKRIVKTCFFTCCLMIILTFGADIAGIVPKRTFSRGSGLTAHAFGFGYYNVVPFTFLFLILEFFYLKSLKKKKASWIELLILLAVNQILYKLSTLRLSYYLVLAALVLYVLLVKFDLGTLSKKWFVALSTLIFPVLFGITMWINVSYDPTNSFYAELNKILTKRLELGNQALERYSINLFGHYIETVSNEAEYFYLDSGFLFSLLGYGLLFTGIALFCYIFLCRYAASENNKVLFIWLTIVAVFSVINNTWISLYINPVLLYVPMLLRGGKHSPVYGSPP